jgi:hypothetical protein
MQRLSCPDSKLCRFERENSLLRSNFWNPFFAAPFSHGSRQWGCSMPTPYLERPIRGLAEALADFKRDPFYQGDVDGLAQCLLSDEGLAQYEARVRADASQHYEDCRPPATPW